MAKGLVPSELDTIEKDFGGDIGLVVAKIKRRMSYGDKEDLTKSIIDFRVSAAALIRMAERDEERLKPEDLADLELKSGKLALLHLNVKEWNVEGNDGQPAPLTDASFRELEPMVADWLLAEIDIRNPKKAPPKPLTSGCSTS